MIDRSRDHDITINTNINSLPSLDFHHLLNTLTSTNDILEINFGYSASIITNTDNKIDNFIIEKLVAFNLLLITYD